MSSLQLFFGGPVRRRSCRRRQQAGPCDVLEKRPSESGSSPEQRRQRRRPDRRDEFVCGACRYALHRFSQQSIVASHVADVASAAVVVETLIAAADVPLPEPGSLLSWAVGSRSSRGASRIGGVSASGLVVSTPTSLPVVLERRDQARVGPGTLGPAHDRVEGYRCGRARSRVAASRIPLHARLAAVGDDERARLGRGRAKRVRLHSVPAHAVAKAAAAALRRRGRRHARQPLRATSREPRHQRSRDARALWSEAGSPRRIRVERRSGIVRAIFGLTRRRVAGAPASRRRLADPDSARRRAPEAVYQRGSRARSPRPERTLTRRTAARDREDRSPRVRNAVDGPTCALRRRVRASTPTPRSPSDMTGRGGTFCAGADLKAIADSHGTA